MAGRDPAPPLRGAVKAGLALWALALVATAWGPGEPVFPGEVAVALVDGAGEPLTGDVAIRCWHVDLDPPYTEANGPSVPDHPFVFRAPACHALQLVAVSPDRAPALIRRGAPEGTLTVTLPPLPEGPPAELRDVGWGGRTTPGAVLEAFRQPDGSFWIVGWDLEGDRPTEVFEQADLWLEPSDPGDDIDRLRVVPGGRLGEGFSALIKLVDAIGTPFPWGAARLPADVEFADAQAEVGGTVGLVGRDLRVYSFAKTGSAGDGPGCFDVEDSCPRWTWTFAVLVMAEDQDTARIPAPRRATSLLPAWDATREVWQEPWALIAARETE